MTQDFHVPTRAIQAAVRGHEEDVLAAVGIRWDGSTSHIRCPYPDHDDKDPSWRWDETKARAYCVCIDRSHSVFDVVMQIEGIDFEAAKLRVANIIGRRDLIKARDGKRYQAMDAATLLRPPTDQRQDQLAGSYLAYRLALAPGEVLMPATPVAGWSLLAYFDPPKGKNAKPKLVGHFPCVVFGTLAPDGRCHAHRIYVAQDGKGKAELGADASGKPRDPKKSAKRREDQDVSGCVVLWGDPAAASHLLLAEGIETAAALAHAHRDALAAGDIAVAAALSTSGIRAFQPWPATRQVTVAADRDEARPEGDRGFKAGEKAARAFALRLHGNLEIRIALPGDAGESVDWLDILRRDGLEPVRLGIAGAARFEPTSDELDGEEQRAKQEVELARIQRLYPLPTLETMTLAYRRTRSGKVMVHRYLGKDENGADQWTPIATPFGIPARLRYADQQGAYGLRVIVQGMDGAPAPIDFDRAALARMGASDIRAHLFASGLRVESEGEAVAVQVLKAADPTAEVKVVSRPGWHRLPGLIDPVFVTPAGAVLGAPNDNAIELSVSVRVAEGLAGTREGWQIAVAAALAASNCPHWLIGLVAGFAGTIAALAGLDTCGINISGFTSSGKTITQKLAASAWGSPRVGAALLQSMRTTENALESLAQASSGTVLALDEVAHVDGRSVGRMIYSVASGVGKARMNAHAELKSRHVWQTFIIFSNECGLEAKIRGDGGTWYAGMAVRLVDIDVSDVNRSVDRATLDAIAGIERHYGHAGPAFVEGLVRDGYHRNPEALRREVLRAAGMIAKDDAGARVRAAVPFALLLVAGELAKAFGLLPASADIREAVLWAWERYTGSSEAAALDPAERAISHLRTWIAERWDVTVKSTGASWDEADGKRINNREAAAWYDTDVVYIPTKTLHEAAGKVLTEREIAQALDQRDLLARRPNNRRIAVRRIPGIGRIDAYALRRDQFGRNSSDTEPDLKVHRGGRP